MLPSLSFSASDSDPSSSPSSSELQLLDSLLPSSVSWDLGASSSSYRTFSLLNQRGQSECHSGRTHGCLSVLTVGCQEKAFIRLGSR